MRLRALTLGPLDMSTWPTVASILEAYEGAWINATLPDRVFLSFPYIEMPIADVGGLCYNGLHKAIHRIERKTGSCKCASDIARSDELVGCWFQAPARASAAKAKLSGISIELGAAARVR
jgi:hypothetical protein